MIRESVKLDLRGETHLDFVENELLLVAQGYSRVRLPAILKGRSLAWNRPIRYQEVNWVGVIRRRQWEMLILAVIFTPLGTFWSVSNLGNWGPMAVGLGVLLLIGIIPLAIFLRGRAYLGIASQSAIVALPLDKHEKAIRRILGLLRQHIPESVSWQLEGTKFNDPEAWDNRAPSGRAFDQKRYALISLLLGIYGLAGLAGQSPRARPFAQGVMVGVLCFALCWMIRAASGKFKPK